MTGESALVAFSTAALFITLSISLLRTIATTLLNSSGLAPRTDKITKIVVEPADGGEGGEAVVVEFEGPLPARELLEAIRRVESAQNQRAEEAAHAG